MWVRLLAPVVVAWLPGALLFRIPVASRERRAALAAEERLFWAVIVSAAWSALVVFVLAAANRYTFGRLLGVDVFVSAVIAAIWRGRLLYRGTAARPGPSLLIPILAVAAGLALFFPTAEYIVGGKDPGTYLSEGVAIAQGGTLVIDDPLVASVPVRTRDLFFPSYRNPTYFSLRFMGFFVLDPARGTVLGQFPHLYPASIAIGYGIDGLNGALRTVGVWAILGVLAVYFVASRLIGRAGAVASAGLLSISLVQVWFARYPNSEMPMQVLLFAGMLAFARAHVDGDAFFAPIAGSLLGLLLFLRFDAVLAVAALGATVVLLLVERRPPRLSFAVPFLLLLAGAAPYYAGLMRPYAERPLIFVTNLKLLHLALLSSAAVALAALAVLARRAGFRRAAKLWVPRLLALAVIGAAVYAYFIRAPGGRLAWHDAASLRTFTWYLPPAALGAALAGYLLVCWRRFWHDPLLLVTVAVYGAFVFYKVQIVPDHFWMARRFVPVILPAALVLASATACYATWLYDPGARRPAPRHLVDALLARARLALIPAAFLLLVGWWLATATRPILNHVEYAGIIPRLEQLAGRVGDSDLLIAESRDSGSDVHVMALPLAYVYARNVLVLASVRPDKPALEEFLTWAAARYRRVYFLGGGGTDLLSRSISATPVDSLFFQVPEYESLRNRYPTRPRLKEFDFGLYALTTATQRAGAFSLDVGELDDLNVVRFHAKQAAGEVTYRWTRTQSFVSVPALGPGLSTLVLSMSNGDRPPTELPARVIVSLEDRRLGEVTVGPGFHPYRFAIPAELAESIAAKRDPATLRIQCSPWNPRRAIGAPDDRELGVMVDRVEIQ